MEAGVSNRYALWNVPQCEWRTVVPNTPSHPHTMTVRHSAPPWPLTFRPGGETGAVPSHANIASIWVPLPLTVYYELEPFMSRQLCVTYTTMDFRPREAPFFGDYFFRFGPIAFKFSHTSFQPKRRFLSIWSVNKKLIIRVLVIAS